MEVVLQNFATASPAIHGTAVAAEDIALRNQLEALIDNVNKSAFDIADLCFKVKSKGYYSKWGFTTFKEYTKSLTGIKERKLQYLTRIAEVMNQVGIKREVYEPVGIAKLREITSLTPGEVWKNPETGTETNVTAFIEGMVEGHKDLSLETIKGHVKTIKGISGDNELVWLQFYIKKSVLDNTVRPALELAKAHVGSVGKDDEGVSQDATDGSAIEIIAIEYLNDPQNSYESLHAVTQEESLEEEQNDVS
jgi:hypothetical protein